MRTFDKENKTFGNQSILNLSVDNGVKYDNRSLINQFVYMVRNKYWRALFESKEFVNHSTSQLRQEYYNKLEEMKLYEFNLQNIQLIQAELKAHLYTSIEDTIISLFDELSYQYAYEDFSKNIHYYNGWKTNKSWKINHRVIIRLNGFDGWDNNPYYSCRVKDKLSDIEKVFNYLDSGFTVDADLAEILLQAQNNYQTKSIETKYFKLDFYKKGTCHITFTNPELLQKFNLFGSLKKGWLPPSFGREKYEDMDEEEKEVVDSFCGREEYNKILERKDYYIPSENSIML